MKLWTLMKFKSILLNSSQCNEMKWKLGHDDSYAWGYLCSKIALSNIFEERLELILKTDSAWKYLST